MDSLQQLAMTSPTLKQEHSPAESFMSAPGDNFPSLFHTPATMDPAEMMTPGSMVDDDQDLDMDLDLEAPADSTSSPAPEKKQTKKRKSWGQVLPEPKTNLPPRKRAKTDDEKEQRRVERVLRNRRAAQSSRERKRLEVEALEEKNKALETQLLQFQKWTLELAQQLDTLKRTHGLGQHTLTLSEPLFSSQDANNVEVKAEHNIMEELMNATHPQVTVNPASISPALSPVADSLPTIPEQAEPAAEPTAAKAAAHSSPDQTQHPAAMLLKSDLQCRSAEAVSQRFPAVALAQTQPLPPVATPQWQMVLFLSSLAHILSSCHRPLILIGMSLKAGFSIAPTLPILNTIIWMVTRPSARRLTVTPTTSTSTTSLITTTSNSPVSPSLAASAASSQTPSTTLRLRLLRKILSNCGSNLARPLLDATLAALQLVLSEERCGVDRVGRRRDGPDAVMESPKNAEDPSSALGEGGAWLDAAALPSKEALLALAWTIKVEMRTMDIRQRREPSLGRLPTAKIDAPPASSPEQNKFFDNLEALWFQGQEGNGAAAMG